MISSTKRKVSFPLVIAATLIAAGCSDSTNGEPEPNVATIQLVIGAQTVTVNKSNGAVTGGPISIKRNTATTITATFLDAAGTADPVASDANKFRLEVSLLSPTSITFTRTTAFAGTLNGTATTTTGTGKFGLRHTTGDHYDLGPFDIPITVVP